MTDFGAKIGAGVKAGMSGADATIIGVVSRISFNSGFTTSGEGVLAGAFNNI